MNIKVLIQDGSKLTIGYDSNVHKVYECNFYDDELNHADTRKFIRKIALDIIEYVSPTRILYEKIKEDFDRLDVLKTLLKEI